MTAIRRGLCWLLLAGVGALACWMGWRCWASARSEAPVAPVDAQYGNDGRFTEM